MAEKKKRFPMVCSECKNVNYLTNMNHKNVKEKLELNKFCSFCKKHTVHKESKFKK